MDHPNSKLAKLTPCELVAVRLYTTSTFPKFNIPLRQEQTPHPFPMMVYFAAEGLKKLWSVAADQPGFNKVVYLFRGMKNKTLEFEDKGGTELSFMSTTAEEAVALQYADSEHPLLFKYKTRGLTKGCSIKYLSVFPDEEEYLYPPLTYLQPEADPVTEGGVTRLEVVPQWA